MKPVESVLAECLPQTYPSEFVRDRKRWLGTHRSCPPLKIQICPELMSLGSTYAPIERYQFHRLLTIGLSQTSLWHIRLVGWDRKEGIDKIRESWEQVRLTASEGCEVRADS